MVTSTNHTICCGSWHSLRISSSTIMTMSRAASLRVLGEFGDRHVQHRKGGVAPLNGDIVEPADFRIAQVFRRRLLRPVQELVAVDDLQDAALVGAVAEIDAVALRPERDRAVQFRRHRAGRAGFLAGQAEIADLYRMRRIAEIVDFGHAAHAPVRHARDQIGDAGIAFPPALVRVVERPRRCATTARDWRDRSTFQISWPCCRTRAADRPRWDRPWAKSCRRRPAPSARRPPRRCLPVPGICARYFGCAGSVTSTIEVPLGSSLPVSGLNGFGISGGAAMMADIGDPAVALMMDGRLIGAACLQVVVADEPHIAGFRRVADLGRARHRDDGRRRGLRDRWLRNASQQ